MQVDADAARASDGLAAAPRRAFRPRLAFDGAGARRHAGLLIADETGAPLDDRLELRPDAEVRELVYDAAGAAAGARLATGDVVAATTVVVAAAPEETARLLQGANANVGRGVADHPAVAATVVDARTGRGGVATALSAVAVAAGVAAKRPALGVAAAAALSLLVRAYPTTAAAAEARPPCYAGVAFDTDENYQLTRVRPSGGGLLPRVAAPPRPRRGYPARSPARLVETSATMFGTMPAVRRRSKTMLAVQRRSRSGAAHAARMIENDARSPAMLAVQRRKRRKND